MYLLPATLEKAAVHARNWKRIFQHFLHIFSEFLDIFQTFIRSNYGFVDNIPDQKESILWALLKLKLNWVLANIWWAPHDQGVDLACRYALLPWEAGPPSQKVSTYKPQLFITLNAQVGFGRACAPRHCAHPSFYAHLQPQRGAAPPSPNPSPLLINYLYTTMRLEIIFRSLSSSSTFGTSWNRTREPALKSSVFYHWTIEDEWTFTKLNSAGKFQLEDKSGRHCSTAKTTRWQQKTENRSLLYYKIIKFLWFFLECWRH